MKNFIAYLEEMVDFGRPCTIKFKGENGGIATIKARLRDIDSDGTEGHIKTVDGFKISITQLIEVNGRSPQNIC